MNEGPGSSPSGGEPAEPVHRVLLVADERFRGSEFAKELKLHLQGKSERVEVFVIAPALAHSGLEHELAAVDGPIEEARERLGSVIDELGSIGISAVGEVGDGDPVVAVGDGVREYEVDEIIVVGHAVGDREYAEKDLWARLKAEFHQPVVALMVGHSEDGSSPGVVEIDREPAKERTEDEQIQETRNFPPVPLRDAIAIVFGFLGTFVLALISVDAGLADKGELSGSAAVILMLAIGAFLINVAHTVGVLFFESVHYSGIWEKFMVWSSVGYTVLALIAAIVFWQL